ncbi:MAG: hypothetical protein IPM29_07065 [Planctomycetes bacterium]|nr:hypothetical protein [Planctomycetota bacterium]
MKPVPLALGELPPFRVPLPFYLTAPWFGMLAGLSWIRDGELAFASRWLPGTLATTHLLTLGVMAMVMVGSLFQVLPVLGGTGVPRARTVGPLVFAALSAGALLLALGLDRSSPALMTAAVVLLAVAFGVFGILAAVSVLRRGRGAPALFTIRLALIALAATVGLGLWMGAGIASPDLGIAYRLSTDAHARLGLGGFALLLVMGVGYQVVPMFQVAPPFDARLVRVTGPVVLLGLALLAVTRSDAVAIPAASGIAASGIAYAIAGWRVMQRRRRRRPEPMVRAWQLAWVCLALALAGGWQWFVWPDLRLAGLPPHRLQMLYATLFVLGFALTVILGMLTKIVPFLSFTHLQRQCLRVRASPASLPTMEQIVSERAAWVQLAVHALALTTAISAVVWPGLGRSAGALLAVDFGVCARNVTVAALRHRRAARRILLAAASAR